MTAPSAGWPRLVVHIGDGKAGSTAIQQVLEAARADLAAQGAAWLGTMLEHCSAAPPHAWQTPSAARMFFHDMPEERAADELARTLGAELAQLAEAGVRTAIWSNEALFHRRAAAAAALGRLRDSGVPLTLVLYLRRHDRRARSAYAQWGIRDKTYAGPVKGFRDWIAENPVAYAHVLSFWEGRFGDALNPRNYDAIADVVPDFLALAGVEGLAGQRRFQTPPSPVLLAWAVNNSRTADPVGFGDFQRLLAASGLDQAQADGVLPSPADLLPADDDLAAVLAGAAADLAAVNAALERHGQPAFDGAPARGMEPPDDWQMLQLTLAMVLSLQRQVLNLRRRIAELER